jgi:hypothetical protein
MAQANSITREHENTAATYGLGLIEWDSRAPAVANGGGTAGRIGDARSAAQD